MEITKMLTLSTVHISKETATLLTEYCAYKTELSLSVYKKSWRGFNYGWFIYIQKNLKNIQKYILIFLMI